MDKYISLLQLFIFLPLILLAAYFSIRYAGRFLASSGRRTGAIQIVERTAVDNRHALYLIRFNDYYLLVGMGPSGITLLKEVPAGEMEESLPGQQEEGLNMGESFQKILQRIRGTEGTGDDER